METIEATGERLAESKKVEFVSSLVLGGRSLLRITMTDGRIVKGHFICLDRKKNLILANVLEERFISLAVYTGKEASEESDILVKRELSQAIILGKLIEKVEIEKKTYDAKLNLPN